MKRFSQNFLFLAALMAAGGTFAQSTPIAADALPTHGRVAAGSATIQQSGNTLNVVQASQRAVVNWQSFNVGANAKVEFVQPNAQAVIHNRVVSVTPSQIDGMIKANGQVIISNANGVVFGKGAQMDAAAIVATTMDINDKDFMEGKSTFKGNGTGAVVNYGKLQTKDPKVISPYWPQKFVMKVTSWPRVDRATPSPWPVALKSLWTSVAINS